MHAARCLVFAALAACVSETSVTTCPAGKPSGECGAVDLRCEDIDEQGCPRWYACAYDGSAGSWSEYGPVAGGPCTSPGQVCAYSPENDTGQDYALECGPSGTWQDKSLCPEQPPMDGSPCEHHLLSCWYDCPEGPGNELLAHCQYTWMVTDLCTKP